MIRLNKALVKELSEPAPGAKDLYFATKFSQGTIGQFKSCLWKQWWTYWRTPEYNIVRMFFTLATALMLGTIFWKIGKKRDSSTDLNIIIGAMYASVLFIGVNNCSTVQPGQTVGFLQLADQTKIIAAIKEAGNIKRFFPSEFGNDVDRTNAVEPAKSAFETKAQICRAVEAEGIPYTYVSSNCFGGYFLPNFSQPGLTAPPRDKVVILGDGNAKAVYNTESDIGSYTVKAVDDPRTLNKVLYIKPASNIYSFNELVSLREKKIGKALEKSYLPEEQLLKNIQEASIPMNVGLAIAHAIFVKGDQTNFEIEPSFGVEASDLYPEVKYTTVDEYLNQFV